MIVAAYMVARVLLLALCSYVVSLGLLRLWLHQKRRKRRNALQQRRMADLYSWRLGGPNGR